ncbi:MAG: NAD(P)-dependent oxidoreductase [Verrucomicrobia bacterium]|nr:NAD(P)-dependent oxidoreductase [Verrucomicrobiota bacterium]
MHKGVVIVTGSAGRIGTSLIAKLGNEYRIVGFELMKAIYASQNEELIPVDISSDESVIQAFRHIKAFYGTHIVSVVHLAAYYSFEDQDYDNYHKITVEGTRRLLEALQEFQVEQFIFSSTMLVHKPSKKRINEYSPKKASWAYPRSKIETEEIIHKHRGKIPAVILRIAGVYDDECHSIPISNQIQRIYEKEFVSHFFPGNLQRGAAFLHMDDLVYAILLTIQKRRELPKETVLLLGEGETLSTDRLQRKISRYLFGKEMRTIRIPKFLAWIGAFLQTHMPFMKKPFIRPWMIRYADDNYLLDIARAKKFLGWEPEHHLEEEIEPMLDRMLEDPAHWYKINGLRPSKHFLQLWQKKKKKQKRAA